MARKKNEDDARNFTTGDMRRVEQELEVTGQHPFNTKEEAEAVANRMAKLAAASKTGALVDVKRSGRAWVVRVHTPKKGGKKK